MVQVEHYLSKEFLLSVKDLAASWRAWPIISLLNVVASTSCSLIRGSETIISLLSSPGEHKQKSHGAAKVPTTLLELKHWTYEKVGSYPPDVLPCLFFSAPF